MQCNFWKLKLRPLVLRNFQIQKKDGILIKDSTVRVRLIEYAELWPYLSGGKPNGKGLFMCLSSHNLVLSGSDTLNSDSLKLI